MELTILHCPVSVDKLGSECRVERGREQRFALKLIVTSEFAARAQKSPRPPLGSGRSSLNTCFSLLIELAVRGKEHSLWTRACTAQSNERTR